MADRFPTIVTVNGSPRSASRTGALLGHIAAALAERVPATIRPIGVAEIGPHLLTALSRDRVSAAGEALLRTIETADLLIVGTPVYRASYSGILKHVFDLVDRDALAGRVALLAATGGTPLHGLVGEHQLRPLLGFFRAITVPTFVYGVATEVVDTATEVVDDALSEPLQARVAQAAGEAASLFPASWARDWPAAHPVAARA
jgi:FMN reductase